MLDKISRVSFTGMFVYRFVMSSEARAKWGSVGVSFSLFIRSLVLSVLYMFGSGARCLIFCVNSLAALYAGALLQLTTGLVGCSGLCILIKPLMVHAEGFMFTYFSLVS